MSTASPRALLSRLAAVLVLGLGLIAAGCGGSDGGDPPPSNTSPPVTSGPLADGEPRELVRAAMNDLLDGSYRANSLTSVTLDSSTDEDLRDELRDIEANVDLRIEAASPRRRTIALSIEVASNQRAFDVVEYDGDAFLSTDAGDTYRALAPELVEMLGGTGAADIDPLLAAAGDFADLGDGERGGQPVRVYEAPLDPEYLKSSRNLGSSSLQGTAFTEATARFELRKADGKLAFQGIFAKAERDLSEASGGEVDGTLVADLRVEFFAMDHDARITVARPTATGDPIETQAEFTEALRAG